MDKSAYIFELFNNQNLKSSYNNNNGLPDEDCECLVYYIDNGSKTEFFDKLYFRKETGHFYFDADCKNEHTLEEWGCSVLHWLFLPNSVTIDGNY